MRQDHTDRNASELSEVSKVEQAAINGGAGEFLRGEVALAREVGTSFAAGETILTTWHECTMNISSC